MLSRRRLVAGTLAMIAAPLAGEAQKAPPASYRVAFLVLTPREDTSSLKPLMERLYELGYVEGRNMTVEYRSAEGLAERLPQLAMLGGPAATSPG